MKRPITTLASLAAAVAALAPSAHAQTAADYTQWVSVSGTTATVHFNPTSSSSMVIAHYSVTGGTAAQQNQNVYMTGSGLQYSLAVAPVSNGETLSYWFTYQKGAPGVQYSTDSSHPFSCVVGSTCNPPAPAPAPAPAPSPSPSPSPSPAPSPAPGGDGSDGASTWNNQMTIQIANHTNGKYPDSQVYWAIIGKDWNTGQFVHVDVNGNLVPMSLSDNTLQKPGDTSANRYANWFIPLSVKSQVTIPPLNSARVLMSVGSPMYIQVNTDGAGAIAYAGANIDNASDPNQNVIFDFGEFALLPKGSVDANGNSSQGVYINTTRVDQFGFPLQLHVTGANYDHTVGETLTESRDQLFKEFVSELPSPFASLTNPHPDVAPAGTRIASPAQWSFSDKINGGAPGPNATYLDAYIGSMWSYFRTHTLSFTLDGMGTFNGHVDGSNNFVFTGGSGKYAGTYYIHGQPSTAEVLRGSGKLNDPSGQVNNDTHLGIDAQLQIQAQACAALNRYVFQTPADWYNPAKFYPAGFASNWYAEFWHKHSIAVPLGNGTSYGESYGFAYDDVGHFSDSLHTVSPSTVTFTIGW